MGNSIEILLVEDNPGDIRLLKEYFQESIHHRFTLHFVETLNKACNVIINENFRFDAILLDLSLPDSQGLNTFIQMRKKAHTIPIIVLSGLENEKIAIKTMEKGAQDYLVKGQITQQTLIKSIRYAIERQQLLTKLERNNDRFLTIIQENADAIIVVDKTGNTKFVNFEALKLFGQNASEFLGWMFDFAENAGEITELSIPLNNKETHIVEMRVVETLWDNETVYLATLRDMTEFKFLRSTLKKSERLSYLGQFVAGIAHEINNPLAFIKSNSSRLSEYFNKLLKIVGFYNSERINIIGENNFDLKFRSLNEGFDWEILINDFKDILNENQEGIELIEKIVSDLLIISHSKPNLEKFEEIDLNTLIKRAVRFVQYKDKNRILIELNLDSNCLVLGQVTKLNQVFLNLLSNAIDAIKNTGTIRITSMLQENFIIVKIWDNGIGIPKKYRQEIFSPFFTTKEVGKGTGLGLAITQSIIEDHNGTISVKSKSNQYTEFTILLPVNPPKSTIVVNHIPNTV